MAVTAKVAMLGVCPQGSEGAGQAHSSQAGTYAAVVEGSFAQRDECLRLAQIVGCLGHEASF